MASNTEMEKQLARLEKAKAEVEKRSTTTLVSGARRSSRDVRSEGSENKIRSMKTLGQTSILTHAKSRRELKQQATKPDKTSKETEPRKSVKTQSKVDKFLKSGVETTKVPNIVVTTGEKNEKDSDESTNKAALSPHAGPSHERRAASEGSIYGKAKQAVIEAAEQGKMDGSHQLDAAKIKELGEILQEAKRYSHRRGSEVDGRTAERQQKRLNYLSDVIKELQGDKSNFSPKEMLSCGYLRLSKSNISTLENMLKEAGETLKIHQHCDLSDISKEDIFQNLKEERSDSGVSTSGNLKSSTGKGKEGSRKYST